MSEDVQAVPCDFCDRPATAHVTWVPETRGLTLCDGHRTDAVERFGEPISTEVFGREAR